MIKWTKSGNHFKGHIGQNKNIESWFYDIYELNGIDYFCDVWITGWVQHGPFASEDEAVKFAEIFEATGARS